MYCFNIMITEKCNAMCTHCYMGERKSILKSLNKQQVDEIISKLPRETEKVVITGGEIFLEKDLLMYMINKLNESNKEIKIELETNGIYLYTGKTLEKMKVFNGKIDSIRFSDDPFHAEGGVNLEKVRGLSKYQSDLDYKIKYLVQNEAVGIGRASKLEKEQTKKSNCMNSAETKKKPYFFIDINGYIYLCPWKLVPPIGNIYIDEMNIILKRLNIPFYNRILIGEIEEAFSIKNTKSVKEYKDITNDIGQCMLCAKLNKKE